VALTLGAVMTLATMSLTAYERVGRSAQLTSAVTVAQQQIERLRTLDYASAGLTAGTTTVQLSGAYEGFVRTTLIQDDVPETGLKQVTVTAVAPAGRRVQLVSLIGSR